jgi:hypothetical protein
MTLNCCIHLNRRASDVEDLDVTPFRPAPNHLSPFTSHLSLPTTHQLDSRP